MPVKHNLFADLKLSKEEVETRAKSDDRLSQLLTEYHVSDADVVKADNQVTPVDPGVDFLDTAEQLAEWSGGEVTWTGDDLAVVRAVYG